MSWNVPNMVLDPIISLMVSFRRFYSFWYQRFTHLDVSDISLLRTTIIPRWKTNEGEIKIYTNKVGRREILAKLYADSVKNSSASTTTTSTSSLSDFKSSTNSKELRANHREGVVEVKRSLSRNELASVSSEFSCSNRSMPNDSASPKVDLNRLNERGYDSFTSAKLWFWNHLLSPFRIIKTTDNLEVLFHCQAKPIQPVERITDVFFSAQLGCNLRSEKLFEVYRTQAYAWYVSRNSQQNENKIIQFYIPRPHLQRKNSAVLIDRKGKGKTVTQLATICSMIHFYLKDAMFQVKCNGIGPIAIVVCPNSSTVKNTASLCRRLLRCTMNHTETFVVESIGLRNIQEVVVGYLEARIIFGKNWWTLILVPHVQRLSCIGDHRTESGWAHKYAVTVIRQEANQAFCFR